jgi:hypothetical protein
VGVSAIPPYNRHARCEKCGTGFTLTAERRDSATPINTFSIPCPSCHDTVIFETSCDLKKKTIRVATVDVRGSRRP